MRGIALFRIGLWAFVALCFGAAISIFVFGSRQGNEEAAYSTPFTLVDQNGAAITEAALRDGKPSAVFFGFTHCPDVCPTTMAELSTIRKQLGAEGDRLQSVFVTLDPERDTAEVLKAYVGNFGPGFTALRGTPEQTAAAAKEFKVFYAKVQGREPGSYTMDHSAASFVFDPQGRVRLYVPYGGDPKNFAADLQQLVKAG